MDFWCWNCCGRAPVGLNIKCLGSPVVALEVLNESLIDGEVILNFLTLIESGENWGWSDFERFVTNLKNMGAWLKVVGKM